MYEVSKNQHGGIQPAGTNGKATTEKPNGTGNGHGGQLATHLNRDLAQSVSVEQLFEGAQRSVARATQALVAQQCTTDGFRKLSPGARELLALLSQPFDSANVTLAHFQELHKGGHLQKLACTQHALDRFTRYFGCYTIIGPAGIGKSLLARALHNNRSLPGRFFELDFRKTSSENHLDLLLGDKIGIFSPSHLEDSAFFTRGKHHTIFVRGLEQTSLDIQEHLAGILIGILCNKLGLARIPISIVFALRERPELLLEQGQLHSRLKLFVRESEVTFGHVLLLAPLSDRVHEEVIVHAQAFVNRLAISQNVPCRVFSSAAARAIGKHAWKGNFNQLNEVLTRAWSRSQGSFIEVKDLVFEAVDSAAPVVARQVLIGAGPTLVDTSMSTVADVPLGDGSGPPSQSFALMVIAPTATNDGAGVKDASTSVVMQPEHRSSESGGIDPISERAEVGSGQLKDGELKNIERTGRAPDPQITMDAVPKAVDGPNAAPVIADAERSSRIDLMRKKVASRRGAGIFVERANTKSAHPAHNVSRRIPATVPSAEPLERKQKFLRFLDATPATQLLPDPKRFRIPVVGRSLAIPTDLDGVSDEVAKILVAAHEGAELSSADWAKVKHPSALSRRVGPGCQQIGIFIFKAYVREILGRYLALFGADAGSLAVVNSRIGHAITQAVNEDFKPNRHDFSVTMRYACGLGIWGRGLTERDILSPTEPLAKLLFELYWRTGDTMLSSFFVMYYVLGATPEELQSRVNFGVEMTAKLVEQTRHVLGNQRGEFAATAAVVAP
jgi:hypothetical protein